MRSGIIDHILNCPFAADAGSTTRGFALLSVLNTTYNHCLLPASAGNGQLLLCIISVCSPPSAGNGQLSIWSIEFSKNKVNTFHLLMYGYYISKL